MEVRLNAEVPHIWYDIIGRIIPGGFLLIGLTSVFLRHQITGVACHLLQFGASVIGITAGLALLILIPAAYAAGFLLGSINHILDLGWRHCWPLKLDEFSPGSKALLSRELGVVDKGNGAKVDRQISRAHTAALHILWTHSEALPAASLGSKRDAEKLASGSLAWAALFTWVGALIGGEHLPLVAHAFFLIFIVLSLRARGHYRRRGPETSLDALAEVRRMEGRKNEGHN